VRPYFDLGFRKSNSSNIASPITTAEAPIAIPTFAPVDKPEFGVACVVLEGSEEEAEPVVVARAFDGEVAVAGNKSELCRFICRRGARSVNAEKVVVGRVIGICRSLKPSVVPDLQVKTGTYVEVATN
jgi:hypothetical protein